MSKSFSIKWKRNFMAIIILALTMIASSIVTYRITLWKLSEEAVESPDTEELVTNDEGAAEPDDFLAVTETLRQKAYDVRTMALWQEQRDAILDIGETLKKLLSSDSAHLLTNNTFNTGEFSVAMTEYPLRESHILRKVEYKLNTSTNSIPSEEARFFLQYLGETSFFSEIEYRWTSEKEFVVLEHTEGCFAFLIHDNYIYTTFNNNARVTDYEVTVYHPNGHAFIVERYVDIPMKMFATDSLQLIQEDNSIKAVILNAHNTPECIFNSADLTFELIKEEMNSAPVDYDMPGLLLGLSDSNGNLRTLFIRKEDERICVDEYAEQIIFSRENKLFSLKRYALYEEYYGDEFGNETEYRTGAINIQKFFCVPLGIQLTADFDKIFDYEPWGYYDVYDIPLYVGEDYVCYIQNSFHSGGGTWRMSPSNIRFDRLDDLTEFMFDIKTWNFGGLVPAFNELTLAELMYGSKAAYLYKPDITTYGGTLHPYVDFTQLSLKRNLGKWSLMLPVMEEYHHPGNGSYSNWIKTFAVYGNDVPAYLLTKDEPIELGGWNNWNAKDLFRFPGSEAALFQFDYFIGIGRDDYDSWGFSDYAISIPVDLDEYIVSISFADTGTQEEWTDELSKIE